MSAPENAPDTALRRRNARLAGLVATAVGMAIVWVASSLTTAVAFPPTAIAEGLIRSAPGETSVFFIEALGHWAKRLLMLGSLAGTMAVGMELPVRTGRTFRPLLAGLLLSVLGLIGSLASPTSAADPGPTAAVLVASAGIYTLLAGGIYRSLSAGRPTDMSRRRAVAVGAGAVAGIALAGGALGWLTRRLRGPDRDVVLAAPERPATVPERADFPDIPGLTPEITSADDHYVVDINLLPPLVEAADWSLTVGGRVDTPFELAFDAVQREFEVVEAYSVLTCISNEVGGPLAGHSAWGGVRLADVLDAAGVQPGSMDVVFRAADGYSDSIPLEVARDPSVILAVSQNGDPLTQSHGFPCRVRVPAIYGMKNVKWLESIEVVPSDFKGYWMERGWSDRAVIKTSSRIDVVGDDRRARIGQETWIAGVAWAGDRGIGSVDVSTDGGKSWVEAMLKEPIAAASWRLWAYPWTPSARGTVAVMCRTTDGTGARQTSEQADPFPSGSSGYHVVEATVF